MPSARRRDRKGSSAPFEARFAYGHDGCLFVVMAGLGPATWLKHIQSCAKGYIYFMTNKPDGVLYVGVTSDLSRRAYEHREGLVPGFTKRYGLKRLVYYETFPMVADAIQREKNIKHWPRAWKVNLITAMNPDWRDLYEELL